MKKQVLTMRIMLVVFIAISAVIAIIQYSSKVAFIAQLMGISWGAIAAPVWLRSYMDFTGKRQQLLPAL